MLTKPDLDQIEKIVEEKVGEKISHLPTKDEFYTSMDKVMGKLVGIEKEMAAMNSTYRNHEGRITVLEEFHPDLPACAS